MTINANTTQQINQEGLQERELSIVKQDDLRESICLSISQRGRQSRAQRSSARTR